MPLRQRRIATTGLALCLLLASAGCAKLREHRGYIVDETLVGAIQPGVDNRDSVTGTLGRPTFVGQFDQRDWYYVSRNTRQLAFSTPKPTAQTLLHIRFDDQGNVASVDRSGLEKIVSITPDADKTPTLGRKHSFFQELFGNIGTVGAAGMGGAPGGDQGGP
ncbi:MAG TPA: outer membrane protein assembly factor BamE [Allosphingosinicella sp.]|nr:outer membrane protein assembly factor BamE [Allosphingosinicella sp.]